MDKITKEQASYLDWAPNPTAMSCSICSMFNAPNGCDLVSGDISLNGVSDYFQLNPNLDVEKSAQPVMIKGHEAMSDNLRMYLPITKVDAVNRLVYGVATAEVADRSNEICDYERTKKNYQRWSDDISKASGGKSLGNVRSMHGKVVAGKLTEMTFNDRGKQIEVCAKIVNDNEWNMVVEGCYTGFSQGGRYVDRFPDPGNARLTRYVADPNELSLVDIPCLPTSTFQLIKSTGPVQEVEIRTFKSIDDEPGVQAAFEKFHQETEDTLEKISLDNDEGKEKDEDKSEEVGDKTEAGTEDSGGQVQKGSPASDSDEEALEKVKQHQPGREKQVKPGEFPVAGTEGETRQAVRVPADAEHKDTGPTVNLNPDSWDGFGTKVDPGDDNKDETCDPKTAEPKTSEGNSGSAAELTNREGSGGFSKSDDGDPGHSNAVSQMWVAKDGKPFSKKADAIAWNEDIDSQELLKQYTAPVEAALAGLKGALDLVDGGELRIHDAQSYDKAWQEALAGTQTRGGVRPLGKIYDSVADVPPAIRNHFKSDVKKLGQWMQVWNSVFAKTSDEKQAFAQAWSAAEKALSQSQDETVAKVHVGIEYADSGLLKDGKARYALDTEGHIKTAWAFLHMPAISGKYKLNDLQACKARVAKAWQSRIHGDGPPDSSKLNGHELLEAIGLNLSKYLYDIGEAACTVLKFEGMGSFLEREALLAGSNSVEASSLLKSVSSVNGFLRDVIETELSDLVKGIGGMVGGPDGDALLDITRAAVGPNSAYLHSVLNRVVGEHEELVSKAALEKGLTYNKSPAVLFIESLNKVGRKLGQVNRMHLQAAHDHIAAMTDGATCDEPDVEKWVSKVGAALSRGARDKLKSAHDSLSDLGADCSMAKGILLRSTDEEISKFEKGIGYGEGSLKKVVDENAVLKKALTIFGGQMKTLQERVEHLSSTPMEPKGVKRVMALEKGHDVGGEAVSGNAVESYSKYLESLSPDQRALEMIKMAQRNPVIIA